MMSNEAKALPQGWVEYENGRHVEHSETSPQVARGILRYAQDDEREDTP